MLCVVVYVPVGRLKVTGLVTELLVNVADAWALSSMPVPMAMALIVSVLLTVIGPV